MENNNFFIGQIPPDFWKSNSASGKWKPGVNKGWGKRYPVRIQGIHSENKAILPDTNLPWLEVMYPVTAGTGHRANYQTANLTEGSFVWVSQIGERYFITGCLGTNEQTLFGTTAVGFTPFSAFNGKEQPPVYNISPKKGFIESSANAMFYENIANYFELQDGVFTTFLDAPTTCEKAPLGAIQNSLKKFIKEITDAKLWFAKQKSNLTNIGIQGNQTPSIGFGLTTLQNFSINSSGFSTIASGAYSAAFIPFNALGSFNSPIGVSTTLNEVFSSGFTNSIDTYQNKEGKQYSIDEYLKAKIQDVSKLISVPLKTLITQIQQFITNTINDKLKNVYYAIFPSELQKVKDKIETANDLLACLFRKIIKNLIKMVAKFLASAVDYLINTPLCAVENFVGALIGKITGLLTSAIDAILSPLKAVFGIFDVVSDILGFVSDLLSGLSCDEEPSCSKIKEWSIWDGPESIASNNTDVSGLISKMKSFAANVQQSVDPDNFDFDLDFSDVFQDTCNVGAIACGPPTIQFSGGGGTGATGNAIVSALGQVIGIDITNSGRGYTSAPLIKFYDACGKGSGAVGMAIIGTVNVQDTTGTTVTTTTTGTTTGTTTATTTGTSTGVTKVIITDTGSGYLSTPDGSLGGDGRTLTDPVKTTSAIYPSKSNGQYPVILKLCDVIIKESGFGYSEGDQVIIEPSNGATAKATISPNGAIIKIDVLTKGEGFTEMPKIYIQSQTGYRSFLIARLCVERVGDDLTIVPVNLEKVIKVVDCPGN
jgi:hypothetical protein